MPTLVQWGFSYQVFSTPGGDTLPDIWQPLVTAARRAAEQAAYAPYSRFCVGAAIELANGQIVVGANVENAAYPSGLCAERVACFSARAQYPGVDCVRMGLVAHDGHAWLSVPPTPCGACRQVLVEQRGLQAAPLALLLAGSQEQWLIDDALALLPLRFSMGG